LRGEVGDRQRDDARRADALLVGNADQWEGAAVERVGRIDDLDGAYGEVREGKAVTEWGIVL
jgi:hypothetical protein